MDIEGQVLSDVHVYMQSICTSSGLSESRFSFKLPESLMCNKQGCHVKSEQGNWSASSNQNDYDQSVGSDGDGDTTACVCNKSEDDDPKSDEDGDLKYDEDGDLIVKRASSEDDDKELVITVAHAMATDLSLVGQQVWLGALLLCDFMLHYSPLFEGHVVLDLGAGVGLTSIVAALMAKTVFCTDYTNEILKVASLNVEHNSHLLHAQDLRVRKIDWKAKIPLEAESEEPTKETDPFTFSTEDLKVLCSCSTVLAAEVVYDLELTDAFFCLLYNLLMKQPAKVVYMTVEKRQIFTTANRKVVSPAYEHFRENLQDMCSVDEGPVRFLCSQIDISFPQYFHYQRTKELELWKIETVFMHK